MPFFCDTRFCFRRARFPVEGTLWVCCRRCHPTSPLRSPQVEKIHEEWQKTHPEYELLSLHCDTSEPSKEKEDSFAFGFQLPSKNRGRKGYA